MKSMLFPCLAIAAAVAASPPVAADGRSALSQAQQASVDKATARMSPEEKKLVAEWSDGKKLAEFFCAKAGLAAIRKQERTADRVFLGPDDDGVKKFVLTGNAQLRGRGSVRVHGGWKEFAFVCDLDAAKATVTGFAVTMDK